MDENLIMDTRDYYFEWLVDLVKADAYYISLIKTLYKIPYHAPIEGLNHNRRLAGIRLRDRFKVDTRRRYPLPSKPCSFLEMMIALAIEMDDKILYEHRFGDRYLDWFWYMVDNAGWSKFTDGDWTPEMEREIRDTCKRIMDLKFEPNGEGSLFPVYNHPETDMRDVDLWRQAFFWIDENLKSGRIE